MKQWTHRRAAPADAPTRHAAQNATATHHAFASKRRRRARRSPRAPAGASWVLRSLIREASVGVGLGVVFGAVWSTMQTGPVSRRIAEYYKNNPTQS